MHLSLLTKPLSIVIIPYVFGLDIHQYRFSYPKAALFDFTQEMERMKFVNTL